VIGSAAAIAGTQQASNHYFQRPDAPHLDYDPAATSLLGYRAQVDAGKRAGSWTGNVALTASSPGYEIKPLAIGIAAGIVIDATIIRALLVPALMRLMGDANWWLPSRPAWLSRKPAVATRGA
jgi:hypothetical protein